jgi:hypothetical protein
MQPFMPGSPSSGSNKVVLPSSQYLKNQLTPLAIPPSHNTLKSPPRKLKLKIRPPEHQVAKKNSTSLLDLASILKRDANSAAPLKKYSS